MISPDNECDDYQAVRRVVSMLAERVIIRISKKSFEKGAKDLGLYSRGTIGLSDEREVTILMDYCIYFPDTRYSPIDREMEMGSYGADTAERLLFEAMKQGNYSAYLLEETSGECRCLFRDLVTGEARVVLDAGLASTAKPGFLLAGVVVPVPGTDFYISSGAFLPIVGSEPAEAIKKILPKFLAAADSGKLSRNRQKVMAKQVIRALLSHGAATKIGYTDDH